MKVRACLSLWAEKPFRGHDCGGMGRCTRIVELKHSAFCGVMYMHCGVEAQRVLWGDVHALLRLKHSAFCGVMYTHCGVEAQRVLWGDVYALWS